ncbi:protein spinster 1 [Trichuris trichiura]|uniref:Protein spinster 1 n=1 Tax=Trichuris trichiura TaxID=36087 RepID=A0A077ZKL0_TRITR|nr:protein spinster 1 [Trichuris trichiura]
MQTVFITFYMVFAPIFGYLGDRYSRKIIMICGVLMWSAAVLLSTFVPSRQFMVFLFLRGVVGIGEASYSTVSVTILGDLFTKSRRSQMLMVFFFAVPLGSGLGFIVGSMVTKVAAGQWQWGVRVTPPLGLLCIGLILLAMEEPKRGSAEQSNIAEITTFVDDIHYLIHVRSYFWTTLAFTCVAFTVGSLSWWTPNFIIYSQRSIGIVPDNAHINTVFGAITALSGFVGVAVGCGWSQLWRRSNPRADPLVCAIGLFIAVPFLFVAICIPHLCLAAVWSIIVPHRRSTANAFQMLTSHLLGDAISPYIIGQFSDYLRGQDQSEKGHYESLQYALFVTPFAAILGAFFFCCCAWCIESDRAKMAAESLGAEV